MSTSRTLLYCVLMLSAKLARRARPPLGVCQPQGLVLPLSSVVDRMMSLVGLSEGAGFGAEAPASTSQVSRAAPEQASSLDPIGFMTRFPRVLADVFAGGPAWLD